MTTTALTTDLLSAALPVLDGWWDPDAALLADPEWAAGPRRHRVRETCWYALGLLSRGSAADVERAVSALDSVLRRQWDDPATPWHGTWRRFPDEPDPSAGSAREWRDYDPNWREFIGCALIQVVTEFGPVLPGELLTRIDAALDLAAGGSHVRGVNPGYSNIALMAGFLQHAVGRRHGNRAWDDDGVRLLGEVADRFESRGALEEYNSPTYYGIDLYALALWRRHGADPDAAARACAVELTLWEDTARHYHAGLANLAGPYDRSYGMDLRDYASAVGLWIWEVVGRARAPHPDHAAAFEHHWDLALAPLIATLGAPALPAETRTALGAFPGPHAVRQVITPSRVATSVLEPHLIVGAEQIDGDRGHLDGQFHPLTVHWRVAPDEPIGWIRLVCDLAIDCVAHAPAAPGRDTASLGLRWGAGGALAFQVRVPGLDPSAVTATRWELPGLRVIIDTPAELTDVAGAADGTWWLTYAADGAARADLDLAWVGPA